MYTREWPKWRRRAQRRNATELDSGISPSHSSQTLSYLTACTIKSWEPLQEDSELYTLTDFSEHIPQKSLVESSLEKVSSLHRPGQGPQQPFGLKEAVSGKICISYVCYLCYLSRYEQWKNTVSNPKFLHIISNTLNHIFTKTVIWRSTELKSNIASFHRWLWHFSRLS